MELIRRAAKTQPQGFIYAQQGAIGLGCYNIPMDSAPEDSPQRRTGCIIGTAMKLWGKLPEGFLAHMRASSARAFSSFAAPETLTLFLAAQMLQDNGMSWDDVAINTEEIARALAEIPGVDKHGAVADYLSRHVDLPRTESPW